MNNFTTALGEAFGAAPAVGTELSVDQLDGWPVPAAMLVSTCLCRAEAPVTATFCRAERPVPRGAAIRG